MNKVVDRLLEEVSLIVKDEGYNIDNITYSKANKKNKRSTLLVNISKIDKTPICVKDCSIVSKLISMTVDVNNLITEPYNLEVSSKGCDDSLFFFNDFVKNIGKLVKVNLKVNKESSSFVGKIIKTSGDKVFFNKIFDTESECVAISMNKIQNAILIKNTGEGEINERSKRVR